MENFWYLWKILRQMGESKSFMSLSILKSIKRVMYSEITVRQRESTVNITEIFILENLNNKITIPENVFNFILTLIIRVRLRFNSICCRKNRNSRKQLNESHTYFANIISTSLYFENKFHDKLTYQIQHVQYRCMYKNVLYLYDER